MVDTSVPYLDPGSLVPYKSRNEEVVFLHRKDEYKDKHKDSLNYHPVDDTPTTVPEPVEPEPVELSSDEPSDITHMPVWWTFPNDSRKSSVDRHIEARRQVMAEIARLQATIAPTKENY